VKLKTGIFGVKHNAFHGRLKGAVCCRHVKLFALQFIAESIEAPDDEGGPRARNAAGHV
jgi:hypothetical protein